MSEDRHRFIDGLKNGDKVVFEEIYRLYYTPLCYYCTRYVGDIADAEEIVQNLFFKLWMNRETNDITVSIKSYLYRSVQNYALNHLSQNKVKDKYIVDKTHISTPYYDNGHQKMEEEELQKILKIAILQLPDKRRKIFELSRFNGMKYSQIAEQLSISVKTVETQMTKALKTLRVALKEYLPFLLWIFSFFDW